MSRVLQCGGMYGIVLLVLLYANLVLGETKERELLVLTTNGTGTDAYKRLLRSGAMFEYEIQALEKEGSPVDGPGQATLLRDAFEKLSKEDEERLVLVIDGPHVILTSGPVRVVEEFAMSEASILVSADGVFRGDKDQKAYFPAIPKGRRFLNAGAFVGTVDAIHRLLKEFSDSTDLQEILTQAYIKPALKRELNIKIDHASTLFQNINGATGDLELRFIGKEAYLQNVMTKSVPGIVRGDDQTKTILNNYGSYLARAWNEEEGCRECWEDMISLQDMSDDEMPMVTLAVFIEKPTPFIEEFLQTLDSLSYPRQRLHLILHNTIEYHKEEVDVWFEKVKKECKTARQLPLEDASLKEWHAKNMALDYCLERDCDFVFVVDSDARIDNPYGLKLLIEQNRRVVAPMLPRPGKAWSNFWGSLTADGFYARADDYMEIIQNERRGLWNVPYVGSSFLIRRDLLDDPQTKPSFIHNLLDPDIAFCQNLREKGIFMYVSNRVDMGHLMSSESFNPSNYHPNLWQLFDNRFDWENRYLHENYSHSLNESVKIQMPCPDVYWFPVFKERFAKEMIELMENYGQWSDGSNMSEKSYRLDVVQAPLSSVGLAKTWQDVLGEFVTPIQKRLFLGYDKFDKRLEGGYETVPTVDIHMNQVNYNDEWLEILRAYVQPLQLRVYDGYYNDVGPPRALMSFTVRYKPDEQPFLRPHHDTSTYTINVGLNRPRIDYQGGGCRFVRYNCSVVDTRVGWMLMHPGRLTHLHEGLSVTGGTRYIIVTFVDP